MHHNARRNPRAVVRWATMGLLLLTMGIPMTGKAQESKGWPHLKYAIYFTYPDIERLLKDSVALQETMEYLSPVKATHVYLECPTNKDINTTPVKQAADAFRARGFAVSGAMVPVGPSGPMCFNNPEHLATLERRARGLAALFDDFILDDWLFTTCTCEKCVDGRGEMSWGDYRTKLLLEASQKYIINPARKVRPGIKVVIKYPNWYEGHREAGYDVEKETRQFDGMVSGIETRTRATHDQHIPIYSGYVFQRWWSRVDPSKWRGSWLDNYTMKGQDNDYVAQVWQAVFAQAPEIILWSGGHLHHTGPYSDVYPHLREMLPEFDRTAGMLKGTPRGVPIYLPYGSEGEYNIFGYLGMIGIPLTPVAEFPVESQVAVFTEHSLRDPALASKLISRLRNGRDVFMTWQLWQRLQNSEFKNTLNFTDIGGTAVTSREFRTRVGWNDHVFQSEKEFTFPRITTTTWPYARELAVVREDYDYGVLLSVPYLNGTLRILNTPDNVYDLLRMPPEALNMIRHAFARELGAQLAGPGGVAMYLFGTDQYALYNMNDQAVDVTLRLRPETVTTGWKELVHNKLIEVGADQSFEKVYAEPQPTGVRLTLQPFEVAVLQAPEKRQ